MQNTLSASASMRSLPIKNLEVAIHKVLISAFTSKGMTSAAANMKAKASMASARALYQKVHAKIVGAPKREDEDRATKLLRNKVLGVAKASDVDPVSPSAEKHVRLAAEAKGKKLGMSLPPVSNSIFAAQLAMCEVTKWAKALP